MKRPLLWCILLYIIGIFIYIEMGVHIASYACIAGAILLVAALPIFRRMPWIIIFCMLFFVLGCISVAISDKQQMNFEAAFYDKPVTIYGKLLSPSKNKEYYTSFTLDVYEIYADNRERPLRKRLDVQLSGIPTVELAARDYVTISGTIEAPRPAMNVGGFDYAKYQRQHEIIGTLMAQNNAIQKAQGDKTLLDQFYGIRISILHLFSNTIHDAGLLQGIVLGDTSLMDDKVLQDFSRCGLTHVVAVSGMHIAILLAFVLMLLRKSTLRLPFRSLIALCMIWLFTMLTAFEPSVVRSSVMASLYLAASLVSRDSDSLTALGIAAGIICALNPYAVLDAGYQLSCLATLGILVFTGPLLRIFSVLPVTLREYVAMTLSAQLLTIPVVSMLFGNVSIIGIIANILVVPYISIIFIGSFALILFGWLIPPLAVLPAGFINYFLVIVTKTAGALSAIPFAAISYMTTKMLMLTYYCAIGLLFVLLSTKHQRYIKLLLMALFSIFLSVCLFSGFQSAQRLRVDFINVGQGDAALVRIPGSLPLLIDTGSSYYSKELVSYLKRQNIHTIDTVILSHSDSDHSGGLEALLRAFEIRQVMFPKSPGFNASSKATYDLASSYGTKMIYAKQADRYAMGDAELAVLWPNGRDGYIKTNNNNSLVLMLTYMDRKFLFTGDLEQEGENALLKTFPKVHCDVLKVSHHGADTGTSASFLGQSTPSFGIISVGTNNYGHPSNETIAKLSPYIGLPYRTDTNATIQFTINKSGKLSIFPMIGE